MAGWLVSIIGMIIKGLFGWLGQKKAEAAESEAATAHEALNTVGESLEVEDNIEEANNDIEENKINVGTEDGGYNFDEYNSRKQ